MRILRITYTLLRFAVREATLSLSVGFLVFAVVLGLSFGVSDFGTLEKQRVVLGSLCPSVANSSEGLQRINDVHEHALAASERFFVDSNLVLAVIAAESRCKSRARSGAGAFGLMQLMPGTAKEMGVQDLASERENVHGGAKYLATLLKRFPSLEHALAAYNAGPEKVRRYGGVPPYRETKRYVKQVMKFYQKFSEQEQAQTSDAQEA